MNLSLRNESCELNIRYIVMLPSPPISPVEFTVPMFQYRLVSPKEVKKCFLRKTQKIKKASNLIKKASNLIKKPSDHCV